MTEQEALVENSDGFHFFTIRQQLSGKNMKLPGLCRERSQTFVWITTVLLIL
ncbi:hypothetical protein CWATWH0003_B072 [Crocosphaera watsonii WH 0003]|uniref:Uncharacterized protein n=2 Tax=Crocosphaera watsonii TaxID=263511 RepID=G5JE85_CROWT|nr:hypothetical protein CWATWH0003_B072 [Crocosphaera watsonii WH 0003]CCQ58392.1 hypothetical protein CWATWH0005_4864 [Crocosphaera watsonii WH 0005]